MIFRHSHEGVSFSLNSTFRSDFNLYPYFSILEMDLILNS